MKKISKRLKWKALLGVFKIKRFFAGWFSEQQLDFKEKSLYIYTNNIREYKTRANSCKKEPETCGWLKKVSGPNEILYDIGANIGSYSLIAASLGTKVYAFEPSPENYSTLHKNSRLNSLSHLIVPLPFVLGSKNSEEEFSAHEVTSGATATFKSGNIDERTREFLPMMKLDSVIEMFQISKPTIMKIDVDGAELEVLKGAAETLSDKSLKSILIEVEEDLKDEVGRIMNENGFQKEEEHERHKGVQNIIYRRV